MRQEVANNETVLAMSGIVNQPSTPKSRIVASGLRLCDVASAAGIHPATLSHYLAGRRRNATTRLKIARAYGRLVHRRISAEEFWAEAA